MKTAAFLLLLSLNLSLFAQDANVETQLQNAKTERDARRKLEADRRAKAALEGKPIQLGGFLTDVARADKKSKLLSLRQPADPKRDARHLYFDERSARPKGFVLFSIGF